jgi:predicted phage tail protein
VQCQTATDGPFVACAPAGTFALDLTAAADGEYRLTVRAVDRAGNVGPSTSTSYVLDTEAPLPPTVTSPTPSPGQDRAPVWTWTTEAGSAATCSLVRGTTVVFAGACADSLGVRLTADGAHVLSVTAVTLPGTRPSPARAGTCWTPRPPLCPSWWVRAARAA